MIELDEIKLQIRHKLPDEDSIEDDLLREYEAAAIDYLNRDTGRYFGPKVAGTEFVVEGNGSALLWLPEAVSAVSAVTQRLYQGDAGTVIATGDDDGWVLRMTLGSSHGNKLIRKGGSLWLRGYEYLINGTIGYDPGEEPHAARQFVRFAVTHWYVNRIPVALGTVAPEIALTAGDLLRTLRRIPA